MKLTQPLSSASPTTASADRRAYAARSAARAARSPLFEPFKRRMVLPLLGKQAAGLTDSNRMPPLGTDR
jgi:hypothetical protein